MTPSTAQARAPVHDNARPSASAPARAAGAAPPATNPLWTRLAMAAPSLTPAGEARIASLRGGGEPLPEAVRTDLEPRFGHDFGAVRVHTGPEAAGAAQALQAEAFTIGQDIVFNRGEYAPSSPAGRRLLAHELTHVVQQSGAEPRIARSPLDLDRLDRELNDGVPLTQAEGEVGRGAAKGKKLEPPTEDESLVIRAEVYRKTPSGTEPPAPPGGSSTSPDGPTEPPSPSPDPDPLDAGVPIPAGVPEPEPVTDPPPPPAPAPAPPPPRRALVIAGIHGDERGPLDLMKKLQSELAAATNPLRRDFDTIVIPEMNPWGVANKIRENQRGVDLNRNFPGLPSQPAPAKAVPPEQPETKAVRTVIERMRPARILALHAIDKASHGGVYADPVEGKARELACRMALLMRGTPLAGGGMTGDINVKGNRIPKGVCESRYPGATPESTNAQSSLGTWASAPVSAGGKGTTVITHEVSEDAPLAASGTGRSVDTMMPGIREFLLDNESAPSEADALLRSSISDKFLTGEGGSGLRSEIEGLVQSRFNDLARHYKEVWLPGQSAAVRRAAPRLTSKSHVRTFPDQRDIVVTELKGHGIGARSTVDEIEAALRVIMQTRSMPGYSRHHWGTEIDVISADRTRWEGSGDLVGVIPFLRGEARAFGFFHPYTNAVASPPTPGFPRASDPHYREEPWHLSYWPIADVLQEEWARRSKDIANAAFQSLIARTAHEIAKRRGISDADMKTALGRLGLPHFQTNVSPSPR